MKKKKDGETLDEEGFVMVRLPNGQRLCRAAVSRAGILLKLRLPKGRNDPYERECVIYLRDLCKLILKAVGEAC